MFSGLAIFLSGVKFVDNFLIEPRTKLGVEFGFERSSEEPFGIENFVCIIFKVFHVLF